MKKFKSVMAFLLAIGMALPMIACGERGTPGGRQEEEVDTSKTQLYVSNFNGGYGDEWLYKAKARFETAYSDTSFSSGKTGVQVFIENSKDQGHNVLTSIADSNIQVYFTQGAYYSDFVNEGLVADITDIMTEELTQYGESRSILSKLRPAQQDYFNVNGKYYAIPYCEGYYGIMYDVDLFDAKGFYFAADMSVDGYTTKYNTDLNNGNNGFIFDKMDVKSNGPDGQPGTTDDGLPATYEEFFMLCDYILDAGCKPIIWNGQYRNDYILDFLRALNVDYEGSQASLNYTFDGTATHIIKSIDAQGNVTFEDPIEINDDNGYMYMATAGKYYAAKFYQQLTSNSLYYHDKCFNETQSHTDAQNDFLFSRPEGEEPIAMMFEGTYWANEARDTFEDIGAQFGEEYDAYHRNIGVMAMPKATKDQIGEPHTVASTSATSLGFINANCNAEELALAKLFLQFVNTDESLREFTVTTNTVKDMEYTLLDTDLAQMTGFGRMLWNTRKSLNRVDRVSDNAIFLNNTETFITQGWEAKIGSTTYNRPADQLRGNSSNKIAAKDYYFGLSNYYNSSWWNNLVGMN